MKCGSIFGLCEMVSGDNDNRFVVEYRLVIRVLHGHVQLDGGARARARWDQHRHRAHPGDVIRRAVP